MLYFDCWLSLLPNAVHLENHKLSFASAVRPTPETPAIQWIHASSAVRSAPMRLPCRCCAVRQVVRLRHGVSRWDRALLKVVNIRSIVSSGEVICWGNP
jgi:hypothetical protein